MASEHEKAEALRKGEHVLQGSLNPEDMTNIHHLFQLVVGQQDMILERIDRSEASVADLRADTNKLVESVQTLRTEVGETRSEVASVRSDLRLHAKDEEDILNNILSAFVRDDHGSPDFSGHRVDHQTRIDSHRIWRRRYDSVVTKLLEAAVLAVLIFIGLAVLASIKTSLVVPGVTG